MSTIGAKASRKGYSVFNTGHPEMSFDADLLPLKVHGGLSWQNPANWVGNPSGIDPYSHNLGYIPAFAIFATGAGSTSQVIADFTHRYLMGANSLHVFPDDAITGKRRRVICFRLPLLTDYLAPITNHPLVTRSSDQDYGIAVSNPGKGVLTPTDMADVRNVAMSSKLRTPFVHRVGGFSGTGSITVYHGLGYSPLFLVYAQDIGGGASYTQLTLNFYGTADNTNIYFNRTGGNYRYVILKDPLL